MKLATVKYEDKAIAGIVKEDNFYGFIRRRLLPQRGFG